MVGGVIALNRPDLWNPDTPFEVQGHRGARGLRPENTLSGIACALEVGVGSIECDVVLSADGVVVLSHDGMVPVPAGPTAVGDLPLSRLREVELGDPGPPGADRSDFCGVPQRMATLGGALALLELFGAHDVRLDIEIKSARHSDPHWDAAHVVDRVLQEVRAHGATDRCGLRSFDLHVLDETRRACPELARSLLVGTVADRVPQALAVADDIDVDTVMAMGAEVDASTLAPGRSLVTRDLVSRAHEARLPVIPWTVNDPAQVRAFVALGVDGICTDRPDVVRAELAAKGVRLPARHRAPEWLGWGWERWPQEDVVAVPQPPGPSAAGRPDRHEGGSAPRVRRHG